MNFFLMKYRNFVHDSIRVTLAIKSVFIKSLCGKCYTALSKRYFTEYQKNLITTCCDPRATRRLEKEIPFIMYINSKYRHSDFFLKDSNCFMKYMMPMS